MTIPKQHDIDKKFLILIYKASNGRMCCDDVYVELASKFPQLTREEMDTSYSNSKSKWANKVQFSRYILGQKRLYLQTK